MAFKRMEQDEKEDSDPRLKSTIRHTWVQTGAIIITILMAAWGWSLDQARDISTLKQIAKNHEESINSLKQTQQLAVQNQASVEKMLAELKIYTDQTLERHRMEDAERFKKAGIK